MPQKPLHVNDLIDVGPSVQQYSARDEDPDLIHYSAEHPSLLKDPKGWWDARSDAEKQSLIDTIGEFGGGLAAGVATGGNPVGIGSGAVLGKNISKAVGKVAGLNPAPSEERQALERTLGAGGAEALDQGVTFGANALGALAGGEGVPRLARAGYRGVKNIPAYARDLIESNITVTPEAQNLQKVAGRANIPLDLAQRTGKPWLQSVKVALDRSPFSMDTIRGFKAQQYQAFDASMQQWLDKLNAGSISKEDFARIAEQNANQLRQKFNSRMQQSATKAANSINPNAVTAGDAGTALSEGLDASFAKRNAAFRPRYDDFLGRYGDADVVMSNAQDRARAIGDQPPADLSRFGGRTQGKVRQVAGLPSTTTPVDPLAMEQADATAKRLGVDGYKDLTGGAKTIVDALLQKAGINPAQLGDITEPPKLTVRQAMQLRTDLLEADRRLTKFDPAYDRRSIPAMLSEVNAALEDGLTAADQSGKALREFQGISADYRKATAPLTSPTAKKIDRATVPENLASSISRQPSAIQEATAAAGDTAMNPLRRNVMDNAVQGATITDPATQMQRISPQAYAQRVQGVGDTTMDALYGPRGNTVTGLAKPQLTEREQLLFKSPYAKAVSQGDPNRIFGEAFPRRDPGTVNETLSQLQETGDAGAGQRALAQGLIDDSRTLNPSLGNGRYINPNTLERHVADYGESVPTGLGAGRNKQLQDYIQLGKDVLQEGAYANTSGTARGMEAAGLMRRVVNPLKWPKLALEAGGYNAAADMMVGQGKPQPLFTGGSVPGGKFYGILGRAAAMKAEPNQYSDQPEPLKPPLTAQDLL